jgi:acyl-coenzyme A thioesterase PaaI-like protein
MTQMQIQSMSHASLSANQDLQIETMMNVTVESHTQFLKTLKKMKKTFKINCTVVSESSAVISLEKVITKANQESEMNVISKALRTELRLSSNKLIDIDFDELIMRTANHRFTF